MQAKNTFEKDFWKLMINSLYGKSIEDKRKHVKADVVLSDITAEKKVRKNQFQEFIILDEDKAIIKMQNNCIFLDKPIYIGFTVLETAKLYMYRLHYDLFRAKYGEGL